MSAASATRGNIQLKPLNFTDHYVLYLSFPVVQRVTALFRHATSTRVVLCDDTLGGRLWSKHIVLIHPWKRTHSSSLLRLLVSSILRPLVCTRITHAGRSYFIDWSLRVNVCTCIAYPTLFAISYLWLRLEQLVDVFSSSIECIISNLVVILG